MVGSVADSTEKPMMSVDRINSASMASGRAVPR
jgi:hypothetical protein